MASVVLVETYSVEAVDKDGKPWGAGFGFRTPDSQRTVAEREGLARWAKRIAELVKVKTEELGLHEIRWTRRALGANGGHTETLWSPDAEVQP